MGRVCAVMGCGSGDSAENTCCGTTVATGIPESIRKMNGIVRILNLYFPLLCIPHSDFKPLIYLFVFLLRMVEVLHKWLTLVQICLLSAG